MVSHAGQEHCSVLAGEIDFHVGDEVHRLRAGDGIFITSDLPHRVSNVGKGEARLLMTAAHAPQDASGDWWEPGVAGRKTQSVKKKQSVMEETS